MKVGVVGLGLRIAHVIGFWLEHRPDTELVCYVDPKPYGIDYLQQRGVAGMRRYDDLQTMLARESLDLLMVGSPNHLHLQHIEIGLRSGVLVFTEKPVVVTPEQTFALLGLLEQYGSDRVMVGLVLRYSPMYQVLRDAIERDLLGELSSIEASEHITPDHGAFFMRDWRRKTEYSGGYMLEKCCHDLDIYHSIVRSRARRVCSFGGRRTFVPGHARLESTAVHHQKPAGWDGVESVFASDADIVDHQVALIEFESGVSMCFHANLYVPDAYRRFCLIGINGTAEGDFERNYLRVHEARSYRQVLDWSDGGDTSAGHYGAEPQMVADVVAHIERGATLPVSVVEALETGLVAMKIDEARASGKVLELDALWQRFDSYNVSPVLARGAAVATAGGNHGRP